MNKHTYQVFFSLLALAIVLYFTCFHHIERLPVNLWDESLFFARAFHFYEYGSYMPDFNVYEYGIDHRNTKLPFTTISQILGLHVFGVSLLALRVPVLLIFIVTLFYFVKYCHREWGSYGIAVLTAFVLCSSVGFLRDHMLRTGDHDIPFACYIFLATMFYYRFEKDRKTRDLWLFSFWVLAALLTKNLLIGLLLPGLVVFAIIRGSIIELLKDKRIYMALISLLGIYGLTIGYYEWQFPGFFDRMWNYELFGRYTKTIDGHGNSFFYFIKEMGTKDFFPFALMLPLAIGLLLKLKCYSSYRNFALLLTSVFIMYLLGISMSSTKVFWYSAPLYPLGAALLAIVCFPVFSENANKGLMRQLPVIAALFLMFPFSIAMKSINNPKTIYPSSKLGFFMEYLESKAAEVDRFTLFDNSFGTGAGFYIEQARAKGTDISYVRKAKFEVGQRVAICRMGLLAKMQETYQLEELYANGDCAMYLVFAQK